MKKLLYLGIAVSMAACQSSQESKVLMQDAFPNPPSATKKPQTFTEHGYSRTDDYFWLKDKTNPDVLSHLKAENAYTDTVMAGTKTLQTKLFDELKGRIKEEDESVPTLSNGYFYYTRTEKGKQYAIRCRKKTLSSPEEIYLDGNKEAEGKAAYIYAGGGVSQDNNTLAIISNYTGSYAEFDLSFRDFKTKKNLPDEVKNVAGFSWANDNKTYFFVKFDKSLRPFQVYRSELGSKDKPVLVYEEKDTKFSVGVGRSKSGEWLVITSGSSTTSELRRFSADAPTDKPEVFIPRQQGVDYGVRFGKDRTFLVYKDDKNPNKKVFELPQTGFQDKATWKEIVPHNPEVRIDDIDLYENYLAYSTRKDGLVQFNIREITSGKTQAVTFPEPVYSAYAMGNPEFNGTTFRYGYSSLNRPNTTFEYDMTTGKSIKLKEQEIPSGFNPDNYTVERLLATAKDGTKIPLAIVYKKGIPRDGSNPALLYGYGSYGITTDADFNSTIFSLVDRGFVYAYAQIRGGADLGEQWYENGKLQKKMNTFTDFIACAEHLISEKYTSSAKLATNGGSAGGLLMGAVMNLRPELFKVVVAEVPFVDVMNTMLDETLPLTTQEYEEWGNPNVKKDYDYMMTYAPYDNLKKGAFPDILATGGLNDSQVGFHEPAKWVAKIRGLQTNKSIVLLKTDMASGHGGATGRFDGLKDDAFKFAFILDRLGLAGK